MTPPTPPTQADVDALVQEITDTEGAEDSAAVYITTIPGLLAAAIAADRAANPGLTLTNVSALQAALKAKTDALITAVGAAPR